MKILFIPNNTENNCFRLRNGMPKEYLEKRGHEVRLQQEFTSQNNPNGITIDPGEIDWCDVVIFNRNYDIEPKYIKALMRYAKEQGKRVVYETDDMLEIVNPSNPAYQTIYKNIELVQMMMIEADVCTTTGQEIADKIKKYNGNVRILPNCMVPSEWTPRKKGNKKVKVGWAGGSSHADDLMIILDVIKELQEEIEFEFVIFGMSPEPWDEHLKNLREKNAKQMIDRPTAPLAPWFKAYTDLDDKLKEIKFTHEPFVPLKEYGNKLSEMNLDIGLCPLVESEFNSCKSCIKFYEYAMVDTVTLASDVAPYTDEVIMTVKNRHHKWKKKIKMLIEDKELRERTLKEQKKWVLENRTIEQNIDKWENVYSEIKL